MAKIQCSEIEKNTRRLKEKHSYYYQDHGQMAIAQFQWCGFICTLKGIHVERIKFDLKFWQDALKLEPVLCEGGDSRTIHNKS